MSGISGLGGVNYSALVQRAAANAKSTAVVSGGEFKIPEASNLEAGSKAPGSSPVGLDKALQDLSESHNLADKMVLDLASGRDLNMHNTMVALEQADIALKYTVQLRNRALSAYDELMRIQV